MMRAMRLRIMRNNFFPFCLTVCLATNPFPKCKPARFHIYLFVRHASSFCCCRRLSTLELTLETEILPFGGRRGGTRTPTGNAHDRFERRASTNSATLPHYPKG